MVERFYPPSLARAAGDQQLSVRRVVGSLLELRSGTSLVIREHSEDVTIKLGPEAFGYRLRPVERGVLTVGRTVVVAYVSGGRVGSIFVLFDTAPG